MAKMTNTSTYKIMFDGSQAENEVQRLRKQLKGVGEELAIVQEKFKGEREWDSGDTAEKLSKRIKELKKTQRSLKSTLDAHITQITGVDSVLADRSAAAYNELTKKRTSLLNLLKRLRLDTEEEMRVYEETSKRLSKVQQEIGERDIDLKSPTTVARAQEVLARPEDYSTKEINEAIAAMTKFRDTKKADSEEWKHWNGYVRNGALFMEEFNQKVKTTNMEELHADLKNAKPTISDKDLNVLVKYWEEMAQGAKAGSTAQADFNKKLAEARDLQTARKREQGEKIVTEVADQGQFGSSLSEMQQRLKLLQDYRTVIDSTKPDAYVRVDAAIEKLTQKIKESQAGFLSYADAMKQAEGLANGTFKANVSDLERMKKSLEEYRETLKIDDTNNLKKINNLLDDIAKKQKELADINKREQSESKIAGVSGNIAGSSPAEIEEAIRLAKELQKMNGTSATQYQSLAKFINEAEAQLKKYNDQVKHAAMENQFLRLANLSKNALEEQRKYWQDVFDNAEKGTAKYIQAERKLVDINKTLTDRKSDEAGAIMGNLKGSSVGDIERAIKMTEELMKAHSRGSAEYEIYAEEIKKAKEYLQSYVDMEKQVDMEDKWSRLRTLSTDALAEQKKYWQEMVNGAQQGTQELADYEAKLKDVVEEERMRLDNKATKVLADPTSFSVKEVQDSIKAYEQLRDAQRTGSGNWEYYNQKIEEARETLKHYNDEAKKTTMEGRLGGIATASTASLAEQKKYWQEMVDGAERGTQALKDYQDNLAKVTAEERTRLQNAAQQTITDYNTGNWNKTIGETKEAVKQLQEYRNTLNEKNDAKALADVDKVLTELAQKTKEAELGYISLTEALRQAGTVSNFQGSIDDLEKLKKRLEEIRNKEIKLGNPDAEEGIKEIDDALAGVDRKLDDLKNGALDLDRILKNPRAASFEDLERAAKVLEKQIKRCAENTAEFAAKSEELRKVNKQLDEIKKSFQEQENIILKTAKRLASYVLVYAGFNEIVGWMKQGINANLELSDSMADVQKTTGLAGVELQELGRSLEAMDTRTATSELYNLAAAAGQIGLKSQEDILGFANAANIISVALNELGAEGSASLMKIAQLTGELRENSTEDALLRIGSAINDLTANSAATAGPITDFINRFGGIAAAAKITTYEMAALGAATDASAQSAEVAGTSMNKFVNALLANTQSVAYAADISYKELQGLIDSGKTMDAIVLVLERMQSMSAGAQQGLLKELGSEGARMNQYVSTLVANLDMLKEQLDISRNAYQENTSVQDEYNVKNESAIGILQRMKNQIIDTFVNSGVTETLKDILLFVSGIPAWLERNRVAWAALNAVLFTFITLKVPATLATIGTGLKQLAVMLSGQFIQVWQRAAWQLQSAMIDAGASVATVTARTSGLTGALRILGHVIKTHPIMFVTSILVSVGAAVLTLIDRTDKLSEATADLSKKHQREAQELAAMRDVILGTNSSYEAQTRVLKDLNTVYEKYLGFEVRILDSYAKKAAALDLVNAKLKEQQELEMYNKERETVNQGFAEDSKDSLDNIKEAFVSIPEIGRKRWAEVKDVIDDALRSGELVISGNHYKDQKVVSQFVQTEILKKLGIAQDKLNAKQKMIIRGAVEDVMEYATLYRDTQVQLNRIDEERQGQIAVNAKNTLDGYKAVAEAQQQDMAASEAAHKANLEDIKRRGAEEKKAEADINKELEEAENRHQRDMLKQNQEYLKTLAQLRDAEQQDVDIKTKAIVETEDINSLKKGVEGVREALDEDAIKAVENFRKTTSEIKALEEELANDKLETDQKKKLSEEEVHNKTVDLYKLQRKQAEELQIAQRKAASFMVREWTDAYTKVEEKVKETTEAMQGDSYGKKWNLEDWKTFGAGTIKNLGSASIESLTATYKALEDESQTITKDISWFNDTFKELLKKPIESQKEMDKLVYRWAGQVKTELESRNRGTTGNFIWKSVGSGGERKAEREARQEMNAALAALEEHFLKRKAIVQQAYLDEKISGAEMQRQIADNDEEFRLARIELRKLLAGDANKFNQSLYPELSGKDLQRTSKMLQTIGDAVIDGLRKNVQKDEVEIREGAIKIRQAFEAEMLKGDYFGVLADNFRDTMDELMLLSSEYERGLGKAIEVGTNGVVKAAQTKGLGLSEQEQKERLSALQGWSEKVNTMTDEMLKNMMLKEGQFSNWLGKLNEDQIQALINKLREYKDSYDEVIKKEAEQMKKLTDARFKGTGQQQTAESRVQTAEGAVEVVDQLSEMGVQGLEPAQYETEINLIKEKMAYQIEWINLLKQEQSIKMQNLQEDLKAAEQRRNDATTVEAQKEAELEIARIRREIAAQTASYNMAVSESSEKMLELQNESIRKYQEQMTRHMDTFQEYSGHLDDFALAMGKGIYGSKEDRQQAARDLLSSVATTTKNVIQQWLMEVTMKKLIDEQELAAERYKQAQLRMIQIQSLASTGQTMIGEMTAGAALSAAQIELNAAEAASKEAAKKGWIGLAIGAAISVALSALLGAALGKINKAKSEVAAATGAGGGRLATGMLTYAEGNYPVLGNDGNVYNAKYEGSGMKTGIYRGGAHFGIFSEKKPEAIIDGDTTQRLIMNHPDIWKAIVTLSKNGRLDSGMGMRTFATGNINDLARQAQDMEASATTDNSAQMAEMQATMAATQQALAQLTQVLAGGIKANINMYGEDGMYKSMKKAEKYAGRVGYK